MPPGSRPSPMMSGCYVCLSLCATGANRFVFDAFRPDIHVRRRIWCSVVSENRNSWRNSSPPINHPQRQLPSSLLSVNLASFFFWVFCRPYAEFTLTLMSLEAADDFRPPRVLIRQFQKIIWNGVTPENCSVKSQKSNVVAYTVILGTYAQYRPNLSLS